MTIHIKEGINKMLISKDKEKRKTENALSSTYTEKKYHVKL